MTTVLRKILEAENLDNIFQPFSKDELRARIQAKVDSHARWLRKEPGGQRGDFYRQDLSGMDLHGANLRGAYLQSANLRGAYLQYANLQDADLQYAYLRGANLRGALRPEDDLGRYGWKADQDGKLYKVEE
jgi:uncharacterized protein YjbI with pentapeptide repeats